jgi:hypothetical protein
MRNAFVPPPGRAAHFGPTRGRTRVHPLQHGRIPGIHPCGAPLPGPFHDRGPRGRNRVHPPENSGGTHHPRETTGADHAPNRGARICPRTPSTPGGTHRYTALADALHTWRDPPVHFTGGRLPGLLELSPGGEREISPPSCHGGTTPPERGAQAHSHTRGALPHGKHHSVTGHHHICDGGTAPNRTSGGAPEAGAQTHPHIRYTTAWHGPDGHTPPPHSEAAERHTGTPRRRCFGDGTGARPRNCGDIPARTGGEVLPRRQAKRANARATPTGRNSPPPNPPQQRRSARKGGHGGSLLPLWPWAASLPVGGGCRQHRLSWPRAAGLFPAAGPLRRRTGNCRPRRRISCRSPPRRVADRATVSIIRTGQAPCIRPPSAIALRARPGAGELPVHHACGQPLSGFRHIPQAAP